MTNIVGYPWRVLGVALWLIIAISVAPWALAQERGAVTNLPVPRFVSLKAAEGNVRRGPSLTHKIDWVLTRRNMPLEVTAEFGHWRRIRDKDGAGGWVHYALLSGNRTVIFETDLVALRARPDAQSTVKAYIEAGVVGHLGRCDIDWCRVTAGKFEGWVEKVALWGVASDEIRE